MNTVQPIRDKEKIHQIESILESQNPQNPRDYILFELGIYSGLRISDILNLKVKDLKNQEFFILKEKKTGKAKRLAINPTLKKELAKYLLNKSNDEYIIKSREGKNKPISRVMAWNILNNVAKQVGISEIGTHSLRKSFAYHLYMQNNKDIVLIQKLLNHSSPQVTLRYIGILQEDMDNAVINLTF